MDLWEVAKKITLENAIRRALNVQKPEYLPEYQVSPKQEKNHAVKSEISQDTTPVITPVITRSYDVKKAFELTMKAIKRGIISPSKFGVQKFMKNEFGVFPSDADVRAWQSKWLELDLIEPVIKNGKNTYQLRRKN